MRTINYKLISLILAATFFGTGCTDEDVLFGNNTTVAPNSGVVSQKNFSVAATSTSLSVYDPTAKTYTATETTITASIGDRKNQTLTDSHTIYFETEYGLIEPSCVTKDGTCSVTWKTSSFDQQNFPANDTGGVFTGSPAVTIIAYTGGEEGFTDFNNNGLYDDFDGGFVDNEEPYVDVGNNGVYDLNDIIIDTVNGNDIYGTNKAHDIADGFFNGPGCTHSTNCSALVWSAVVWEGVVIKLDGGTVAEFSLGGNVTGLTGSLELKNGAETLPVYANGPFTFVNTIPNATTYAVTILTQPAGQTCSVTGGSGTINSADFTSVAVDCVPNYSVGGNISGLVGTVTLQNNGADNLAVSTNGAFTFATSPADGSTYNVTVSADPVGQKCTVTGGDNGTGGGTVAGAPVTSVVVTCTSTPYTIGGTVTNLIGTGLTLLENNSSETLQVNAGTFTFTTQFFTTDTYNVTVTGSPAGQSCTIDGTSGKGTVVDSNITSISITCIDVSYNVGGAISNLDGDILLLNNGGDATIVSTTTPSTKLFNMNSKMVTGDTYDITVSSSPLGQTCFVQSGGTGTVGTTDVTSVVISCTDKLYNINAAVSGMTGGTLSLLNNGGDQLDFTVDGTQTFVTQVANNANYDVTVSAQPTGQTCTVSSPTGTVSAADVTVNVTCVANTISGTITGTAFPSGSLDVVLNGGLETINMTANGAIPFTSTLDNGASYAVTVINNTTTLGCTITGGSNNDGTGTVTGPVTGITVTCN